MTSTLLYESVPAEGRPPSPPWMFEATVEMQELYEDWRVLAGDRPLPALADLDLPALAGRFAGLILAKAAPGQDPHAYLFHPLFDAAAIVCGTSRGLDPALFQHIPVTGCRVAAIKRAPLADRISQLSSDGMAIDCDIVYLPLAPDGGQVDAILILAVEMLPADFVF
ncbi:hypothetical protein [Dongia sp.]|uniref:hypothetical protein n=1 Tax=Dongia sp. TaxID=1977262 RepID=UPI0035B49800